MIPGFVTLLWNISSLSGDLAEATHHSTKYWMQVVQDLECAQVFEAVKKLLAAVPALAHYDPCLPTKMAGDASAYSIEGVIPHMFLDGNLHPVAFASCTLTKTNIVPGVWSSEILAVSTCLDASLYLLLIVNPSQLFLV